MYSWYLDQSGYRDSKSKSRCNRSCQFSIRLVSIGRQLRKIDLARYTVRIGVVIRVLSMITRDGCLHLAEILQLSVC